MGGEVPTEASRIAIPGFELVEELGRGAETAVYRAVRDGEEYAVKIQELSGPDDPSPPVLPPRSGHPGSDPPPVPR
jgi:hypothetical protein